MVATLIIYIVSNIFALGFQQFAFMQFVREPTPYRRVLLVAKIAFFFFVLTAAFGLYYYTSYYELYEMAGVLEGKYSWVQPFLVETKWVVLILAPIFSISFLVLAKRIAKRPNPTHKTWALLIALTALGLGALNIGTEMLIGEAAI